MLQDNVEEFIPTDKELSIMAEICRLRRCVLIHSIIYYRFNTSIISDFQYDKFAKKLYKLQCEYPKLSEHVEFGYEDFKDWDGCSGFNLNLGDIWGQRKALYLLKMVEGMKESKTYR